MQNLQRDLFLLLSLALMPLLLLAAEAVFGRFHRWRVERLMKRSVAPDDPVAFQEAAGERAPLELREIEASHVAPAHGAAASATAAAADATRRFRQALLFSSLAYIVIVTCTVLAVMRPMPPGGNGLAIAAWSLQGPALWLLLWNIVDSVRTRVLAITAYLMVGAGLIVFAREPRTAAVLLAILADLFVVMPMAGVTLLAVRRLRPVLVGLVAIVAFGAIAGAVALLVTRLSLQPGEIASVGWQVWVIGIANWILALPITGWLIRQGSVRRPLAGLAVVILLGVLCNWMGLRVPALVLIGLPSAIAQVYFVWLLFRLIIRLQDRRHLPAQVLQFHLCLGLLTVYYEIVLGGNRLFGSAPGLPTLAFAAAAGALHLLLRRQVNAAREHPRWRLLFLRTFGGSEKPERLLDWLDDTWRRLGRIDLMAGTDLAMRTLGSRMLEAILLRRADAEFLKTRDDVQGRMRQLRSEMEGDARFPINEVYCYASAWRPAVVMLAPESDAVLMDLSGFTRGNTGCVFELRQLVHLVPLERILLITDAATDCAALTEILQAAWARLPAASPNAGGASSSLTLLKFSGRAADDASALVCLLVTAATSVQRREELG